MPLGDLTSYAYYVLVYNFLQDKISHFQSQVVQNTTNWVTGAALVLVTLWIMIQGFRIVTGRSPGSMMEFVMNSSRVVLIIAVATSMSLFNSDLRSYLSADGDLASEISGLLTGSSSPVSQIDQNMAATQLTMAAIDVLQVSPGNTVVAGEKDRALLMATFGASSPAMAAGAMLLMYQFTIAIFIGLGPLFILSLIFEQTKNLFHRWLYYGIATLFSIAMLDVVSSIVLDMMLRITGALWASDLINSITMQSAEGFTNQAMQQGGIGLLMTVLIISVPPIAGHFFGGTVGNFLSYSAFGNNARPGAQGRPSGSYVPAPPIYTAGSQGQPASHGGGGTSSFSAQAARTTSNPPAASLDQTKKYS